MRAIIASLLLACLAPLMGCGRCITPTCKSDQVLMNCQCCRLPGGDCTSDRDCCSFVCQAGKCGCAPGPSDMSLTGSGTYYRCGQQPAICCNGCSDLGICM